MRKALLVLIGCVLAVSLAHAGVPPCRPGTLASYIALGAGGCTAGTVTFANFAYTAKASGGAPKIPAAQIKVNPIFAIPSTGSLSFSAMWGVAAGQTQESIIRYTVMGHVTSSGSLMLQLGTHQAGAGGALGVHETTNAGNLQVYENCVGMCRSVTTATLPFVPTTAGLQVTDDVKLSTSGAFTSLAAFTASFDFCAPCV